MSLKESISKIRESISKLVYASVYQASNQQRPFKAENLVTLRNAVDLISDLDFLKSPITAVKTSGLYDSLSDTHLFTSTQNANIGHSIQTLRSGLAALIDYYDKAESIQFKTPESILNIKLPDVNDFDELSKIANDLKKSIQIPLLDSKAGEVKILSAEHGSIWIVIGVGTVAAVKLIGAICKAAAYHRTEQARAEIMIGYARMINAEAGIVENLAALTNSRIESIKEAEAEAIAAKFYDGASPEALGRLKNSIESVSTLLEKGAKFLPSSENKEAQSDFPDFDLSSIAASAIKQITSDSFTAKL